ncbi:MAG: type II toxin-antitoxin system RelE/ParE family toxin, partial [Rhodobacter sp.]|nr:type II toxin-antitoxin system RelE/ParE family toxin [Rhodobacter sp.]MCY4240507.1 type II toxin-antitoxin system RelE/ParE family toxin [Rhodobacter sp.]
MIDADLGGGVIKQRIARRGGGRSGGFRTILLFRRGEL